MAVGQVLWYSFGKYNSSAATIDGVPAGQTEWGTPTAASIFQDIRSDNWNGSTPPTYGTPGTYGTVGYYISQSTGNCFFNNGIFRGDITGASGTFTGTVQSGSTGNRVILNESSSSYLKVYDSGGNTIYSLSGVAGLYTNSILTGASAINALGVTNAAGYAGSAISGTSNGTGHGVVGVTNDTGTIRNGVLGTSAGTGSAAAGVYGNNSSSFGLFSNGQMGISNSTMVTNLNSEFSNKILGSAGTNTLRFVQGTVTGTGVATFNAANKPASNSTNVWMQITIDSTTLYIPVWT